MTGRIPARAVWRAAVEHDDHLSPTARAVGIAVDNLDGWVDDWSALAEQIGASDGQVAAALEELDRAEYAVRKPDGFVLRHYKSIATQHNYTA